MEIKNIKDLRVAYQSYLDSPPSILDPNSYNYIQERDNIYDAGTFLINFFTNRIIDNTKIVIYVNEFWKLLKQYNENEMVNIYYYIIATIDDIIDISCKFELFETAENLRRFRKKIYQYDNSIN